MRDFRIYMAVGGMPQVVDAFVRGKDYRQIDMLKRNILSLYEEDLGKYDDENKQPLAIRHDSFLVADDAAAAMPKL